MTKKSIAKSIRTVNVIEDADGEINMTSYRDNPAGNRAAEELFGQFAKENGADERDIGDAIQDGYYHCIDRNGDYTLYLIHSS